MEKSIMTNTYSQNLESIIRKIFDALETQIARRKNLLEQAKIINESNGLKTYLITLSINNTSYKTLLYAENDIAAKLLAKTIFQHATLLNMKRIGI